VNIMATTTSLRSALTLVLIASAATLHAADITFAWSPVEDSRVGRYEVHYGTTSRTYATSVACSQPTITVSGLNASTTYYAAARACTSDGRTCSAFSNEAAVTIPAATPTPTPTEPVLSSAVATPSGTANLTSEGVTDWAHWGLSSAVPVSRKSGVTPQIGALTPFGGSAARFADTTRTALTWTDGTPQARATTNSGMQIGGLNKGFELRVPADTQSRTLNLYLGGNKTQGRLEVRLSDNSVTPYSVVLENLSGTFNRRVSLSYRAASAGQSLIVRYTQTRSAGKIAVQAATLSGGSCATTNTTVSTTTPRTSEPAFEIGEVEITHEWTTVPYQGTYQNPVVVAKALSSNDRAPAILRIRNINATSFEIRAQEWDHNDGFHALETAAYMVMERGRYTLANGTQIEAGSVQTNTTGIFKSHRFSAPFRTAPIVFTAVTSANEADAVTARLRSVSTSAFAMGLREQEANAQQHAAERVDYIAWQASTGTIAGLRYAVGRTPRQLNDRVSTLAYPTLFNQAPVVIADLQTSKEDDTAALRWQNLTGTSVDLFVQEETSRDSETCHVNEVAGWFLADVD
jgi:hypothetical protein